MKIALSALFLLIIATLGILISCDNRGNLAVDVKPRFVIVLLDETQSFGIDTTRFWPEVKSWAIEIAKRIEPGEGFGVIGIDDHGFDADDIRLSPKILDENPLKCTQQKRELVNMLKQLPVRHTNRQYTDILGSLNQAAQIFSSESKYRGVIVIFSDMIQTPQFPTLTDAANLKYPDGTKVYCFYVNATKGNNSVDGKRWWQQIVDAWIPIFEVTGLEYQNDEGFKYFYERGMTQIGIDNLFPKE